MPTRALGALLAAVAAALFVVSIVTAAWWDGHPRVDGHVFTAKDVHIGLLGGEGCNTGGAGACQSLELGPTVRIAGYGELGAVGLATLLALLVAGAAWTVSDSRKQIAKAALAITALAALGGVALLLIGPQIKSSQQVEAPIGWGLFVFGGGVAAAVLASITTMRVEREPLRLKTAKAPPEPAFDVRDILRSQHDGLRPSAPSMNPGASGSMPGALVPQAPQLRPLYDVQGAVPAPAAPYLPQRAPTPIPRADAHAMAGLDYERPPTFESAETGLKPRQPTPPGFDPRAASPSGAPPFGAPTAQPFGAPTAQPFGAPTAQPFGAPIGAPPIGSSPGVPPTGAPPSPGAPPFGARSKPPTGAPPPGLPGMPPAPPLDARAKPPTGAPPFGQSPGLPGMPPVPPAVPRAPGLPSASAIPAPRPAPFARPATQPPPFAEPAVAPTPYEPPPRPGTAVRVKAASVPPPTRPSVVGDSAADPLGKTMPAPGKTMPPPPRAAKPSVPPPARSGVRPIVPLPAKPLVPPTPAASAAPAGAPAPRASAPTLTHSVPPMPQIDTPPTQRASTEADDRLDASMRDTEYHTAVEIDAEAKAAAKGPAGVPAGTEGDEATGISEPPVPEPAVARTTSEERAEIHDEGLAPHARGDVPGDDTDALETAARERVDADALDTVAPPPPAEQVPFRSLSALRSPPTPAARAPVKPPLSTAPPSLPPPKTVNIPASGPTPACPQCEAPMAWVEEHLRFYCKSCRMYF